MKAQEGNGDFRKDAERHWQFIEKMLKTYTEEENKRTVNMETCHYLYVEAMIHGYKHALSIHASVSKGEK